MQCRHDLVIRGGTIADGSGGALFEADVAVQGGRIVEIGRVAGTGAEEIDAKGLLVTPGFVDIHTHYDGQITWEDRLASSSLHGVTTILAGNCGVGFAPCRPDHRDLLVKVMEGVEDIPEIVMTEGLPWNWESFPEYLDSLESRRSDIDFAVQVPHSAVRVFVMGKRGADLEPPTHDDLAQMRRIVTEGIRAGALGVSTSRCLSHRTRAGALAPSVLTEEEELIALAHGLRDAGAGVFQIIPRTAADDTDPVQEMAMMRRLMVASGRPLSFTLLHKSERPQQLNIILGELEAIRAEGLPMLAQVCPRPLGVLFGLDLSFHPFRFRPSYAAIEHLPLAERVAAMRDPALRARLLAERPEHSNPAFVRITGAIDTLCELGDPPNYEPGPEDTLAARARTMGISAAELAYDILISDGGTKLLLWPAANYVGHSLDEVRPLLTRNDTLIALGDGGAHYGMICDSSYTTTLLAYWTRDRGRDLIALPQAVKSLSHDTARAVGLSDRGRIAVGLRGDLNLIDYDRLGLQLPYIRRDLPAGGRRLHQGATGYRATIVNGVPAYRDGAATGALPGRLIRGPR
ncbi:amidohydrolase [Rhizorhabdus dicambivorans]|uniref:N-acyl-D-amino-acid deacylase family protein n=1 Tax=Rhizorhabdus dicambivorans TaxID=1850238 RepID=UPI0008353C06|nr:amidohydrolase family protein [Rhizorhabdus dicambivorans]ATE66411.1 amidohydrolase [Rhizorhabdus dicambivorans]